jgi:hypothetical protein
MSRGCGEIPFRDESQMVPLLEHAFANRLADPGETWAVVPEHGTSTRVADLVFARFDEAAHADRARVSTRALTSTEITALWAMRADRDTSAARLSQEMRVTERTAVTILRRLALDGFAEISSQARFRRTVALHPVFTRFIVVEAKLSEWQKALHQARAHAAFAHEVYVALDAAHAARVRRAAGIYAESGIGLITVASSGTVTWRLQPKRRRPALLQRMQAAEAVWRRMMGDSPTPVPQTRLPNARVESVDLGVRWLPERPPIRPPHRRPASALQSSRPAPRRSGR